MALSVPRELRLAFGGSLGERIERNLDHWILTAPTANPGMLDMFRARDRRPEPALVPWAGEFAGKYLISAVQSLRMTERPEVERFVRRFVGELLATQHGGGYLGPFPERERLLGHWDLWGHYHVMLGLLLWHDRSGDPAALAAVTRAADLIVKTYVGSGRRVLDAGSPEMNMAVIHVLGRLYRLTGTEAYLRLIREIEKDWEEAGDYVRQGVAGVDFFRTPRPRWESLHSIQGILELYRITGDERYRTALLNLWQSIATRDRHNTGGFSTGEQAVGDPWTPGAIETCCTVAWVALSVDVLQLTGDPRIADELELSTWNGILGAQHPSGRWWTYNTPMDGVREASAHSIVFQARAGAPELNCCSVNAPRGLGMLSEWGILTGGDDVVVNFYGPAESRLRLADGTRLRLTQDTEYPGGDGTIRLTVYLDREVEFTLRLRVPGWSAASEGSAPGGRPEVLVPGRYWSVRRLWRAGDTVELKLDMHPRCTSGGWPQEGRVSVHRGPILLAFDPRWNELDGEDLQPLDALLVPWETRLLGGAEEEPWRPILKVSVPDATGRRVILCDFASAGATGRPYRSWLPARRLEPARVLLDLPRRGALLPPGRVLFAWNKGTPAVADTVCSLEVSSSESFDSLAFVEPCGRSRVVVDTKKIGLAEGARYFWRVKARNESGLSACEPRTFVLDPSAPAESVPVAWSAPEPDEDGVLVSDSLRGKPDPDYGLLLDARGTTAARGPTGGEAAAVAVNGQDGRVRYAIPWFPQRDYSVVVRVAPQSFPGDRIAQIFSAWAGGMDDPLRITIEGGRLFARLEAERAYSTDGVDLERERWIHVAAVKSGDRLFLYVDGEERQSTRVPELVRSRAESVALGANPNYKGDEYLDGRLAHFRLYARALTPLEVRASSERGLMEPK